MGVRPEGRLRSREASGLAGNGPHVSCSRDAPFTTLPGNLTYLHLERFVTRRPLLATTSAVAALALCAAAGSASAASTGAAAGRATSSLSVLTLSVGGHELSLADLLLTSDTVASPRVSSVSFTPVTVDGTAYGQQKVDQSTSPQTVAAVSAPSALSPFARLTSPALDISATSTPSNHAGADSLGTVQVLGLPVRLSGALSTASSVSSTAGAQGLKTVTIDDLALPSIADVLAALGLDLSELPVGSVDDLVNALELVTSAIVTAEGVVDDAQEAVDDATADLATKTTALTSAQATAATAQTAFDTAETALNAAIATNSVALGLLGITDIADLLAAVDPALTTALALPGMTDAFGDYNAADTALDAATAAVATAQAAVDTAQALVTSLTATLTTVLNNLFTLLQARLDATPLVSLDSLEVSTRAVASSASKGGQHAEVVGGTVKGLHVLGVDVIATALGSSTLDLEGVTSAALADVNDLIGEVTGTLSEVLSSVPGFPQLEVPAPVVGLLTKSTSTSISDGYGRASTVVNGLSITVPGITIPSALALPGAASLPAMTGVTQVSGLISSAPLSLSVLTLRDQAAFRPSTVGGPSAGGPGTDGELADTGLPVGVAALSLLLVGGALTVRRRLITVA